MINKSEITITVNGERFNEVVEPRMLASDFIREQLKLTGTHVGCEHGVCGACTILVDGKTTRSCRIHWEPCFGALCRYFYLLLLIRAF